MACAIITKSTNLREAGELLPQDRWRFCGKKQNDRLQRHVLASQRLDELLHRADVAAHKNVPRHVLEILPLRHCQVDRLVRVVINLGQPFYDNGLRLHSVVATLFMCRAPCA